MDSKYAEYCCERPSASFSDEYVKTIEKELLKLSEAFKEYGQHHLMCASRCGFSNKDICDCGFNKALTPAEEVCGK